MEKLINGPLNKKGLFFLTEQAVLSRQLVILVQQFNDSMKYSDYFFSLPSLVC